MKFIVMSGVIMQEFKRINQAYDYAAQIKDARVEVLLEPKDRVRPLNIPKENNSVDQCPYIFFL